MTKPPKSVRYNVPTVNGIHEFFNRLHKYSDREAVIICHSLLEATLEDLARDVMHPEADSSLFSKLLSSYSSLFTLLHAFGHIPTELKNALRDIGYIRNKFAHSLEGVDFENSEVIELCRGLHLEAYQRSPSEIAATPQVIHSDIEPFGDLGQGENDVFIIYTDKWGHAFLEIQYDNKKILDDSEAKTRFILNVQFAWLMLTARIQADRQKP